MLKYQQLCFKDREGNQRCQQRKEYGNLNLTKRRIPKDLHPHRRMSPLFPCKNDFNLKEDPDIHSLRAQQEPCLE